MNSACSELSSSVSMWPSSGTLLLLLPFVVLGAVGQNGRNFIQAPNNCKPPFALINDRCVFVVVGGDSEEMGCSEGSNTPCQKRDYPSKSVLPRETVLHVDAITDGNNNNEPGERSFLGTINCKGGYRRNGRRCRETYTRPDGLRQEEGGDVNGVDSQIEDIYNTLSETNPANTDIANKNINAILRKCKPGYRPDRRGRCRKIFTAGSSNVQKDQNPRPYPGRGVIQVATSGCKAGYRLDKNGRCRKIYTPISSNSMNDENEEAELTKAFIQVPGCAAGAVVINGDCRPVYSGKRDAYGEDYADTNENPLMQSDLVRRRRSLRNQKHQRQLYSGSEE